MKILFVTLEAMPLVKVGGLGDVCQALPRALNQAGADVRVILPFFKKTDFPPGFGQQGPQGHSRQGGADNDTVIHNMKILYR